MNKQNFISLIIATYNRCEFLKDTLDSLLNQECDNTFDYEVIVVDNNSSDMTKAIVSAYKDKFNGRLRYVFEPRQGKSFALNLAIKEAKGEILGFTDDDVLVDKQWLSNIGRCFQNYNCDGVGGRVLPLYPKNTPKWVKDNKDLLDGPIVLYDYGESIQIYNKEDMLSFVGSNMFFRKSCFLEHGLFRIDLGPGTGIMGDDSDFFKTLLRTRKKLFYCGNALVWHKVVNERMSLRYIAKWFIAAGRYDIVKAYSEPVGNNIIFYFGFPRYLIREVIEDSMSLIFLIFRKREFLKKWLKIFNNIGIISQYRKKYRAI